jgi:hypothetical protein
MTFQVSLELLPMKMDYSFISLPRLRITCRLDSSITSLPAAVSAGSLAAPASCFCLSLRRCFRCPVKLPSVLISPTMPSCTPTQNRSSFRRSTSSVRPSLSSSTSRTLLRSTAQSANHLYCGTRTSSIQTWCSWTRSQESFSCLTRTDSGTRKHLSTHSCTDFPIII